MKIEFNGRKIVKADHFIYCNNCPLDILGSDCLGYIVFGTDCKTGFKYEDSI